MASTERVSRIDGLRLVGTVDIQAAAADSQQRPTFAIRAYNGGAIRPRSPSLDAPLVLDLSGFTASVPGAALLDHDETAIVGQIDRVDIGTSSIDVTGFLTGDIANPNDPAGKVALHARNGFTWKGSLDARIDRLEYIDAGDVVTVNGRPFAGPLYIARTGTVLGVSFLTMPADLGAIARVAAATQSKEIRMDFHEWLKASGFDPAALTDAQRDKLQKQFEREQAELKAAQTKPEGAPQDDPALNAALAPIKEKERRKAALLNIVTRFAQQYPESIEAIEATGRVAIAEDWIPERLELMLTRDLRPEVPHTSLTGSRAERLPQEVYEAALCMAGKLENIDKVFDSKTLELAAKRWRHGLGLAELFLTAARANGYTGLSHRDVGSLLRGAFGPADRLRGAGASTIDVSGILSNVANKFIARFFEGVENAWSQIAAIRPVSDFKTITSYSLTGDMQYAKVKPGGEIEHGTLGEQAYTNKADTYGRLFAIDRRDIINDDLGAFTQVARRLGRGGALALNHVFWSTFMSSLSTMFTTAHGNYASGATTALSLSSLSTLDTMFRKQKDPDGKPIAISPAILLVPVDLSITAMNLVQSIELRTIIDAASGSGTTTSYGTTNVLAGRYRVVSSAYLSNSSYTGSSTTAWFLLADPQEMPVMEVCFLNGVDRPTVEQAVADFDTLGVKMRGYFDFGCATQEYRGGVMSKGAA